MLQRYNSGSSVEHRTCLKQLGTGPVRVHTVPWLSEDDGTKHKGHSFRYTPFSWFQTSCMKTAKNKSLYWEHFTVNHKNSCHVLWSDETNLHFLVIHTISMFGKQKWAAYEEKHLIPMVQHESGSELPEGCLVNGGSALWILHICKGVLMFSMKSERGMTVSVLAGAAGMKLQAIALLSSCDTLCGSSSLLGVKDGKKLYQLWMTSRKQSKPPAEF